MRTILITQKRPDLLEKVEAACRGGIDAVSLRDKEAEGRDLFELAQKLRKITREYGAALFINTRADIALRVEADGVHVPENCPIPKRFPLQIGASVHSLEAARRAESEGANFLFLSPIFDSPGKGNPVGLDSLKTIVQNTSIPVYALGGVTPEKIPSILEAGAYGAAVISAILNASEIETSARAFSSQFIKPKFQFRGIYGVVSTLEAGIDAIEKGVSAIQFRYKEAFTRDIFATLEHLLGQCRKAKIPFIVNDRVDIAKALGADGVHLGQTDLPIQEARKFLGREKIIGISASNVQEAQEAERAGADYVGVGAVFPTQSKFKLTPPIGLETVRLIKKGISIPLIAIGGINEQNAFQVFEASADGIAVLSALQRVLTHARL